MRQTLLAGTAVLAFGFAAGPAVAASEVALEPGGYFNAANGAGCAGRLVDHLIPAAPHPLDDLGLSAGGGCGSFAPGFGQGFALPWGGGEFQIALSQNGDAIHDPAFGGSGLDPDPLAYGVYSFKGEDWAMSASVGASLDFDVDRNAGPDSEPPSYQANVNLAFGGFSVSGLLHYYEGLTSDDASDLDRWVAGAGIAYSMDEWTVGAHYSHLDQDSATSGGDDLKLDRLTLMGNYVVEPGIVFDGELGYVWTDSNPDADASVDERDDYRALEIGIGTNFTF